MKKIYWDAGHGGGDPGAVSNGLKEADLAKKVVEYATAYMEKSYNCVVYKDVTADSTHTISARSNKWRSDLFVSVHFNAGGGDGYEALVYSSKNKKLGQVFEKYVKAVGQNSRGVKYRPELNVLRLTNCPAILNEIAFIDTKKDIKDWDSNGELKVMGEALADAAADYLNLKKKTFKIKPKMNLKVREKASLTSKELDKIAKKGEVYTIVNTNGDRGELKSGGWVTITDKYAERI